MLLSLHIRDFVLVKQLSLDFAHGFTVLTGETGAGKSILLDALGLALGERGDASMIRQGCDKTEVSAEFAVTPSVATWLAAQDLEAAETLLLRRVVDQSGRSKAFINGSPVPLAQLRSVGELLVDIHGQHAHQSLLRADAQRHLLDEHAHLKALSAQVAAHYKEWQQLAQQMAHAEQNVAGLAREREQLAWQVEQIAQLDLQRDEWANIQSEQQRLAHAANLLELAEQSAQVLSEGEQAVADQLNSLLTRLQQFSRYDARLTPIAELLDAARINVQEAGYALSDYLQKSDLDPARLQQVEDRMQAIHDCARKLRLAPEALLTQLNTWQTALAALQASTDLAQLQQAVQAAETAYRQAATALSTQRQAAAVALGQAVTQAMQDLSLAGGQFAVQLTPRKQAAAHGLEDVEFLVAGHAGVSPRPLNKVASGGELARISLALSVITSQATPVPTLIFDEVDSGIGGAVAEVVGKLLAKLGQDRQVLCVTHLPQVAAQGSQHFVVRKSTEAGQTLSEIQALSDAERVDEIARMLGGISITNTTRQHAKEMLR